MTEEKMYINEWFMNELASFMWSVMIMIKSMRHLLNIEDWPHTNTYRIKRSERWFRSFIVWVFKEDGELSLILFLSFTQSIKHSSTKMLMLLMISHLHCSHSHSLTLTHILAKLIAIAIISQTTITTMCPNDIDQSQTERLDDCLRESEYIYIYIMYKVKLKSISFSLSFFSLLLSSPNNFWPIQRSDLFMSIIDVCMCGSSSHFWPSISNEFGIVCLEACFLVYIIL